MVLILAAPTEAMTREFPAPQNQEVGMYNRIDGRHKVLRYITLSSLKLLMTFTRCRLLRQCIASYGQAIRIGSC